MERVLAFECKYGVIKYRKPTIKEGYYLGEQYSDLPAKFSKFKDLKEDDNEGNVDKLKLINNITGRIYDTMIENKFIVGCELTVGEDVINNVELMGDYLELKEDVSALCFAFIGLVFGIDLKKNTLPTTSIS